MARAEYQYSTSPRKLEPEYRSQKRKQKLREVKVSKEQKRKRIQLTITVIAIFGLLLTISYRNSQINEKFNEMQSLKKELSSLQKENEQLKVNIANGLNLANIEKLAKEKLGMQKLTNKQIVYVSLPKKDYVESASEKVVIKDQTNWFEKLVNKIFNK